jgi:YihY family inner membrane protein
VSTAAPVPETWELTGDDARRTLMHTGHWQLLRDAFIRLRYSDGFSHARSLAYLGALVVLQGTIALVGLSSALGRSDVGTVVVRTFRGIFPGAAGRVLTQTVNQARDAGTAGQYLGLAFGLVGGIIAGTTLLGQIERGLNRIYGIEQDRPFQQKYGRALLLCVSVGTLTAAAFVALAFGRQLGDAFESDTLNAVWAVVRWPLGLGATAAAMALLFRSAPFRRQPRFAWLAFGSAVAVVLWAIVTVALGIFFRSSSAFGKTYGPLAGIVALMIWTLLSAIAVLYGGAVAAQLEAVRSAAAGPRDPQKKAEADAHQLLEAAR